MYYSDQWKFRRAINRSTGKDFRRAMASYRSRSPQKTVPDDAIHVLLKYMSSIMCP